MQMRELDSESVSVVLSVDLGRVPACRWLLLVICSPSSKGKQKTQFAQPLACSIQAPPTARCSPATKYSVLP